MLPDQTIIRYSATKKVLSFLLAVGMLCAAVILWKTANGAGSYIAAILVSLAAGFSLFISVREILLLRRPQLILSLKGLTTVEGRFYDWNAIDNVRVERKGKYSWLHFTIQPPRPYNVKLDTDELTKSPEKIKELIIQYQQQSAGVA